MAGDPAAAGYDTHGRRDSVDIVWLGLRPDQDHRHFGGCQLGGLVCIEADGPGGSARGCWGAAGQEAVFQVIIVQVIGELRDQEIGELFGVHSKQRLVLGDQAFMGHVHCRSNC